MRLCISECLQAYNQHRELGEPPMSKAGLAKALGVHPSQVSRWDIGRRRVTVDAARRIAEVLHCEVAHLIPGPDGCLKGNTHEATCEATKHQTS